MDAAYRASLAKISSDPAMFNPCITPPLLPAP